MESNTSGTQAKFEENLVDFDYEIWSKFNLKLYWLCDEGSTEVVYPLRVLGIRKHPEYQIVGLVKGEFSEEVILFSKETGMDRSRQRVLMDLDSFLIDPLDRSTSTWDALSIVARQLWRLAKLPKIIVLRKLKKLYGQKSTT